MTVPSALPPRDVARHSVVASTKIATRHLAKLAIVYVRQSSGAGKSARTLSRHSYSTVSSSEPEFMAGQASGSKLSTTIWA